MLSSCFGIRSSRRRHDDNDDNDGNDDAEHQPLLPQYDGETARQEYLHEKLHTYQMLRAMSNGYMPSNDQVITHLRALLSSDTLNPETPGLSPSGRALVRTLRLWLNEFIDLLQAKNSEDRIQDFIWYLAKTRPEIDASHLRARASTSKAKADTAATVSSLKTVGSLLLTNSDFRIFLEDLSTISRQVFRDTAFTLADVAHRAGKQIAPSEEEQAALKHANGDKHADGDAQSAPSKEDLEREVVQATQVVSGGAADVANEAAQSLKEHVQGDEQAELARRLKQAVLKLRQRPDYSESVSTLSLLLRRYLVAYSRAASDTIHAVEEDVDASPEADRALGDFWALVTSLGSRDAWSQVEESFHDVVDAGQSDPGFEELVDKLSKLVQDMLMDPEFFDNADDRFQQVRAKAKELTSDSSIADKVDGLLTNLGSAFHSVAHDSEINKLVRTSNRIAHLLSPKGAYINEQLVSDTVDIFLPAVLRAIQYVPIPRLEVATPAVDLLLENLILEPGRTVNNSSFLPHRLQILTQNDIEVRKARFRTTSSMTTILTIRASGLSVAAEGLGYWLHLHSGLLRMMDEGIAGFHLDERGIDIMLSVEIGRAHLENIVSLRKVDVRIHHLNYTLGRSKFACLAWVLKPFIRPIVRKALEIKIASAIEEGLHTLNKELVLARERLRATRIAGPEDLWTFIRAVVARLIPASLPDVEARLGLRPTIFRDRYAPGSLVRVWEREAEETGQKIYEYERAGWRNEIFSVRVRPAAEATRE